MYLFGASGHGKVIIDIIISSHADLKIEAVYDDNPKHRNIMTIPTFLTDSNINHIDNEWIICIGDNLVRKKVSKRIRGKYLKAIHKNAVISNVSVIGEGTVVMAGAIINADVLIGRHCIINTGSIIEHDCNIGDFAHISPNASLAGDVAVGEGVHVGIGATIIQGIKIGKWVTIGAGAVIIADIPDYAVVVGNPGKIIKYSNQEQ